MGVRFSFIANSVPPPDDFPSMLTSPGKEALTLSGGRWRFGCAIDEQQPRRAKNQNNLPTVPSIPYQISSDVIHPHDETNLFYSLCAQGEPGKFS